MLTSGLRLLAVFLNLEIKQMGLFPFLGLVCMDVLPFILGGGVSLVGLVAGALMGKRLAARNDSYLLQSSAHHGVDSVLKSADRRREVILQEAQRAAKEQFEEERARIEEESAVVLELQEDCEKGINDRQGELDRKQNELIQAEAALQERLTATKGSFEQAHDHTAQLEDLHQQLKGSLVVRTGANLEILEHESKETLLNSEKLGISKWLIENGEELKAQSRRLAKDSLSSVYVRYNPTFVWPKIPFTIEASNLAFVERHFAEGAALLTHVLTGTESTIEILKQSEANAGKQIAILKIAGGAGVDKEVLRLSLEEIVSKGVLNPDKVQAVLNRHRKTVDRFVMKLGEEALKQLGLPPTHPEILRLIGSLNYRTSHRQNQYFHSVEVARLAGMLADEVGVDPILAKRSGLMHDIGKVMDWKIEGSHAVISGDYAVRYGEAEDLVDTVLAHHDDKVVETPHAYILKAADAMSGARPGARVDVEDGYQKRIEGIQEVVQSFQPNGVLQTAIMHAGREVHVFVDSRKVKQNKMDDLAQEICKKLESDVQYPGQIKVTIVRRMEISEVA
jgi:ribonucrease Y